VLQFAPDGRVFVGQRNGVIKVFASLADTAPVTFADLSTEVDDYWDRGLLGLALDPGCRCHRPGGSPMWTVRRGGRGSRARRRGRRRLTAWWPPGSA
jgi:hypothetical protein